MRRIELTGASGVGKTTLYNAICSISSEKRNYITLNEAFIKSAYREEISLKNFKAYLLQVVLKTGFLKSKNLGLSKRIIYELIENRKVINRYDYEKFSTSFMIQYRWYLEKNDPYYIYKRLSSLMKNIEEYMILEYYFPDNQIILFDEGLIHSHCGITEYGFNNFSSCNLKEDKLLNPFAIISCEQSTDVIYKRALQRKKNGVNTFSHGPLNDEELKKWVQQNVDYHQRKMRSFEKWGIPIFKIDTQKNLEFNINEINNFVDSLI